MLLRLRMSKDCLHKFYRLALAWNHRRLLLSTVSQPVAGKSALCFVVAKWRCHWLLTTTGCRWPLPSVHILLEELFQEGHCRIISSPVHMLLVTRKAKTEPTPVETKTGITPKIYTAAMYRGTKRNFRRWWPSITGDWKLLTLHLLSCSKIEKGSG